MESSRLLMASIFSKISLDTLANFVLRLSSSSSTTAVSSPGASSVICRAVLAGAVCRFFLGGLTEVSAAAAVVVVVGVVVVAVATDADADAEVEAEAEAEAEAAMVSVLGGSLVMTGGCCGESWRGFSMDRKWMERQLLRPTPLLPPSSLYIQPRDIIHRIHSRRK